MALAKTLARQGALTLELMQMAQARERTAVEKPRARAERERMKHGAQSDAALPDTLDVMAGARSSTPSPLGSSRRWRPTSSPRPRRYGSSTSQADPPGSTPSTSRPATAAVRRRMSG
jgi:hypothetical protein